MKNQIPHFLKPINAYVFGCVLISAAFLMSCETSADEVLPLDVQAHANGTTTKQEDKKDLPHQELAKLRAAVARYHNIKHAIADGYTLEFTGYRHQMGFHYLKPALLDDHYELERPEVLMYAPAPNGGLRFVGVEYAATIADMNNPPAAPQGFSGDEDVWAINTEFNVWTLHVWIGLNNPNGIFAPHNPRLP